MLSFDLLICVIFRALKKYAKNTCHGSSNADLKLASFYGIDSYRGVAILLTFLSRERKEIRNSYFFHFLVVSGFASLNFYFMVCYYHSVLNIQIR